VIGVPLPPCPWPVPPELQAGGGFLLSSQLRHAGALLQKRASGNCDGGAAASASTPAPSPPGWSLGQTLTRASGKHAEAPSSFADTEWLGSQGHGAPGGTAAAPVPWGRDVDLLHCEPQTLSALRFAPPPPAASAGAGTCFGEEGEGAFGMPLQPLHRTASEAAALPRLPPLTRLYPSLAAAYADRANPDAAAAAAACAAEVAASLRSLLAAGLHSGCIAADGTLISMP